MDTSLIILIISLLGLFSYFAYQAYLEFDDWTCFIYTFIGKQDDGTICLTDCVCESGNCCGGVCVSKELKEGETCETNCECSGFQLGIPGTLACCSGKCTPQRPDYSTGLMIGACPDVCQNAPLTSLVGETGKCCSCPSISECYSVYEKCITDTPLQITTCKTNRDKCITNSTECARKNQICTGTEKKWPREQGDKCAVGEDCNDYSLNFTKGSVDCCRKLEFSNITTGYGADFDLYGKCSKRSVDIIDDTEIPDELKTIAYGVIPELKTNRYICQETKDAILGIQNTFTDLEEQGKQFVEDSQKTIEDAVDTAIDTIDRTYREFETSLNNLGTNALSTIQNFIIVPSSGEIAAAGLPDPNVVSTTLTSAYNNTTAEVEKSTKEAVKVVSSGYDSVAKFVAPLFYG